MTHDSHETHLVNDFRAVRISLASPDDVRAWSSGEVVSPDTLNYRTHRPVKGGLFCERIFGPERDGECACGKLRGVKHKGQVCERCGVQAAEGRTRRTRMGHIDLAAPVVHVWFFKGRPSPLALLLDLKAAELEAVVYYRGYLVLERPGAAARAAGLRKGQFLGEEDYRRLSARCGAGLAAGTGAEALAQRLAGLKLAPLARRLRAGLARASVEKRTRLARRLEVVEALLNSPNRPEWMVLTRIPVIPADLRPMVLLENGTYATSDLNDLYRRVIQRNNRLKKLADLGAPEVIVRNEKRLLQQAVDALFDNTRGGNPVLGMRKRPLRSLADMLKGKEGRFRENLLGKRVDYSARSVIVVGPELRLHQCGLPKAIALELFGPFLVRRLIEQDGKLNVHRARRMIRERRPAVFDALEGVMRSHPVLLNRAPTLHRMGIQAFEPVLVEGNAIRLHPLVCKAFNADFDGDQMAVHLPLSEAAVGEARDRLMPTSNVFSPANGQPIITPSKDMVLGCYHLTLRLDGAGAPRAFASVAEVLLAHAQGRLGTHDAVVVRLPAACRVVTDDAPPVRAAGGQRLSTTVGRVLFNADVGGGGVFYDLVLTGKNLSRIIAEGGGQTVPLLERVMKVGFGEATRSGLSFAADDLCAPADKAGLLAAAQRQADHLAGLYADGLVGAKERHRLVTELWQETTKQVSARLMAALAADRRPNQPLNPVHAMVASGARGSALQLTQLAGMRGLMRRPSGEVLETPIKASFREGLSPVEYFHSAHGARKGLVDMALVTAQTGYLTRKLVDAAQHVVVSVEDCGAVRGVVRTASRLHPLAAAVRGRTCCQEVKHPVTGDVLVAAGELVSAEQARALEAAGVGRLEVRSPMTCRAARGVCRRCYGQDLSTGRLVERGAAVGVLAAQSIGEPTTQLTMRTFHDSGMAAAGDLTQRLPRLVELLEAYRSKQAAVLAEVAGRVRLGQPGEGAGRGRGPAAVVFVQPLDDSGRPAGPEVAHAVLAGKPVMRQEGERVGAGEPLTEGRPCPHDLLRTAGLDAARLYLLEEVQAVYRLEGVDIDDKHVEVIVARMFSKVRVTDAGGTPLLPGQVVEHAAVQAANAGRAAGSRPARCAPLLLGVSKAAVGSDSFLSAASFQETTKVLTQAALAGKVDELRGLKENVLLGRLVPAGTGLRPA
jgi:DNA-directed RNA polymerase subunit beta'